MPDEQETETAVAKKKKKVTPCSVCGAPVANAATRKAVAKKSAPEIAAMLEGDALCSGCKRHKLAEEIAAGIAAGASK